MRSQAVLLFVDVALFPFCQKSASSSSTPDAGRQRRDNSGSRTRISDWVARDLDSQASDLCAACPDEVLATFSEDIERAHELEREGRVRARESSIRLESLSGVKRRKRSLRSMVHLVFDAAGPDGRVRCPLLPEHGGAYKGGSVHGSFVPDQRGTGKHMRHLERWHPAILINYERAASCGRGEAVNSSLPPFLSSFSDMAQVHQEGIGQGCSENSVY